MSSFPQPDPIACERMQQLLWLSEYDEVSAAERQALQNHLQSCALCQSESNRIREVRAVLDARQIDPEAADMQLARRQLLAKIAALQANPAPVSSPLRWLPTWSVRPAFRQSWWFRAACSLGLVCLGFLLGQVMPVTNSRWDLAAPGSHLQASRISMLEQVDEQRVRVVLEQPVYRVLTGSVADDRVRRLLLQATRQESKPWLRARSIELLAQQSPDGETRRAALKALKEDPDPNVRVKALEVLRASMEDADVRTTLSSVLLTDEDPAVRLRAVDVLAVQPDRSLVGVLQQAAQMEADGQLRQRCRSLLQQMKASVEAF